MVEDVQRMDKDGDVVDELSVSPNSITLERLVNLGDYENVRLGGQFRVPVGMNTEEAVQKVTDKVIQQVEAYLHRGDVDSYAKRRLNAVKENLERFKANLSQIEEDKEVKLRRLKAEILEIGGMLRNIKSYTQNLNSNAADLFYIVDELLKENEVTLEDLGLKDYYQLPKKFTVEWLEMEDSEAEEDEA